MSLPQQQDVIIRATTKSQLAKTYDVTVQTLMRNLRRHNLDFGCRKTLFANEVNAIYTALGPPERRLQVEIGRL